MCPPPLVAARYGYCGCWRSGGELPLSVTTTGAPGAHRRQTSDSAVSDTQLSRLRVYNLVMGAFHAVQAIAVLVLANDFALPVTATYQNGPPGSDNAELTTLFDLPTAWGVAAFLAISAVAHWTIASPGVVGWYGASLRFGRNSARWVEYSVSSSIMIVLIAQLTGINDIATIVALFGVNAAMILFGWLQEVYEFPGSGGWLPFVFGCIAGVVPWVAIAIYLLSPGNPSAGGPPGFVYGIFVSLFVFFNVFALNQWLQYRRVGRWRDYVFGEYVYVALSLVAKSALAWQVFAGTLAG